VEAEVASGRLVAPFDLELMDECAWYFVAPQAIAEQPKVVAFRDWLFEEIRRAHPASAGDAQVPV
jgi:LysR family glycine cleavage system transcriptional activator